MGFIMEFARHLVLKMMEDPEERDKKFREHVYTVKDRCAKTKEMWSLPMRPYGFWTFERHNSQLAWDAQISQVQGRRDPYDEALQQFSDAHKVLRIEWYFIYDFCLMSEWLSLKMLLLAHLQFTMGNEIVTSSFGGKL
ncbi:hypothetical protein HN51_024304 [Arachis hypogaea]